MNVLNYELTVLYYFITLLVCLQQKIINYYSSIHNFLLKYDHLSYQPLFRARDCRPSKFYDTPLLTIVLWRLKLHVEGRFRVYTFYAYKVTNEKLLSSTSSRDKMYFFTRFLVLILKETKHFAFLSLILCIVCLAGFFFPPPLFEKEICHYFATPTKLFVPITFWLNGLTL